MMNPRITRRDAIKVLGAGALVPLAACQQPAPAAPKPLGPMHFVSLQDVAKQIAAKQISPVALTRQMLDRIAGVDKTLSSYATVMADQAMAAAAAAEKEINAGKYRGPLHGVPIAVKDLLYTKGVRTMAGTKVLEDFVPDEDGTVVAKLIAAGAVILGKLNLTEGAMLGYNPARGIPLNPWDNSRWPGASSSGSGVATAAGLCFAAIGTDTGGSIRFPSSACGLAGLKPTYGRVSRHGVWGLSDSLDHVGPIARRVADAAIVFDAIAGNDPKDTTSLSDPAPPALAETGKDIKGLRIGIDRTYAMKGTDPGQAAAIEAALKTLQDLGAQVVDVKMPDVSGWTNVWIAICGPEALAIHKPYFPARAADYGPYFRDFMGLASTFKPEQLEGARKARQAFAAQLNAVLESVDAMACPAGGDPAWAITHDLQLAPFNDVMAAWGKAAPRAAEFTIPMDLAGTPAICVPSGFSPQGLPYSIQFAGRRLSEPMLCRIAHAYEQATPWHDRHPQV